jgi:hypothetical protein
MEHEQMTSDDHPIVEVRRQWNDYLIARYRLVDVWNLPWDWISGGIGVPTPRRFIHGYVRCNEMLDGELSHSCQHGPPPHEIKVCITKKGNERVWPQVLAKLEADEQQR